MAKKTRKQSSQKGFWKNSSKPVKWGIVILLLVFAGAVIVGALQMTGVINLGSPIDPPVVVTPDATTYTLNVLDPYDGTNEEIEDAEASIWELDTSDYTASQLEDLSDDIEDFSKYTLDATKSWDDVEITPEEGFYYMLRVNLTGYSEVWLTSFYSSDLGSPQRLGLGVNTVYLVNESASMSIVAYSINNGTEPVKDTNNRDWSVSAICKDADGEMTRLEGYRAHYDIENSANQAFILRIEFNTTGALSYVDSNNIGIINEAVSGNCTFIEINSIMMNGVETFEIEFSSGLGTTFEAESISIGTGSASSFTLLDIAA